VWVIFSITSVRAPSSMHKLMKVWRIPWRRRACTPTRSQSARRSRRVFFASRAVSSRVGTMRSSAVGARPTKRFHPPSFHSPRIAASVGCTGTSRTAPVLVSFSLRSREFQERSFTMRPSGLSVGS